MKYIKISFLFIIITFITGCWNYRELNKLSIISAIGVDIEGEYYIVSADIVNSKNVASNSQSSTSSQESPTTLYKIKAKTMKEALNNLVFEVPNQLYTGHLNLLVIGEEVAKKGLYDILDYFIADIEVRKIFPTIVIENGKAIDALKIILPLNTITAENIRKSLEADAELTSYLSNIKFDEILNCLYMEGRHMTISSVKIVGSPEEGKNIESISSTIPKASLKVTGSAIFKEDKLVGYLHDLDSLGYNTLRGLSKTTAIQYPCDNEDNYGVVVIDNFKAKVKATIRNNKPIFEIVVNGKASTTEFNCKIDLKDPEKAIKNVEKMLNNEIKKILSNTLTKLQKELKSDVIGFGEKLYKEHYKYWQKVKDDWDEKVFPTVEYKIESKVLIKSIDSTSMPAKELK